MSDASTGVSERGNLNSRETCDCGRPTIKYRNYCSAECYQKALEDSDVVGNIPCPNDFWWCTGPEGPSTDGEAWGGKCSDCYLHTDE